MIKKNLIIVLNIFFKKLKKILTKIRDIYIDKIHPNPRRMRDGVNFNKDLLAYNFYEKDELIKSYNYFKKYFANSIFLKSEEIREYAIKESVDNKVNLDDYYLEFGVFKGAGINLFSKFVKKIYGFDGFEGLKEDWKGFRNQKGVCNLDGTIPKVNNNVVIIKGWVQDTLIPFLKEHSPAINFIHIDLDTYESSKFVLENVKPYMNNECIILFDELYNYPGWEVGEFKALKEVFDENEYEYLAFAINGEQAVIKYTKS